MIVFITHQLVFHRTRYTDPMSLDIANFHSCRLNKFLPHIDRILLRFYAARLILHHLTIQDSWSTPCKRKLDCDLVQEIHGQYFPVVHNNDRKWA